MLKLGILARHGVIISVEQVTGTVLQPERADAGYAGRMIAQARLDPTHVLRVVFEETDDTITVTTMYRARSERYG